MARSGPFRTSTAGVVPSADEEIQPVKSVLLQLLNEATVAQPPVGLATPRDHLAGGEEVLRVIDAYVDRRVVPRWSQKLGLR